DVVTVDVLTSRDKKVTACKEAKKKLEERFKTGKNRLSYDLFSSCALISLQCFNCCSCCKVLFLVNDIVANLAAWLLIAVVVFIEF
nr:60S ribosomal protein L27-like [Tanacetum cinerariifolium]